VYDDSKVKYLIHLVLGEDYRCVLMSPVPFVKEPKTKSTISSLVEPVVTKSMSTVSVEPTPPTSASVSLLVYQFCLQALQ